VFAVSFAVWKKLEIQENALLYIVKKVKLSRWGLAVAQRVGRGIALLFHDRGTKRG